MYKYLFFQSGVSYFTFLSLSFPSIFYFSSNMSFSDSFKMKLTVNLPVSLMRRLCPAARLWSAESSLQAKEEITPLVCHLLLQLNFSNVKKIVSDIQIR